MVGLADDQDFPCIFPAAISVRRRGRPCPTGRQLPIRQLSEIRKRPFAWRPSSAHPDQAEIRQTADRGRAWLVLDHRFWHVSVGRRLSGRDETGAEPVVAFRTDYTR